MVVLPCFAIGMSVCRGRYDGKDYDLWAQRLGAEGWSWNEVSWRLIKKGSVFFWFLMGTFGPQNHRNIWF